MWKLEKLGHKNIFYTFFFWDGNGLLLQICLQKTWHLLGICSFFSFNTWSSIKSQRWHKGSQRRGTDSSLTGRRVGNPSFLSSFTPAACRHSCDKTCEIRAPSGCTLLLISRFNFTPPPPPSTKSLHPVTSVLQVGVTGRQRDRRAERQVHRRSDSHLPEDFLWWVFLISLQTVFYNLWEARAYCKKNFFYKWKETDIDK